MTTPKLPKLASLTKYEKETSMVFNEDDPHVVIWSCSGPVLRKLARLGFKPVDETFNRRGELTGRRFHVPLEAFTWGAKRKGRKLTDEQRQAARERLFSRSRPSQEAVSSTEHASAVPAPVPGPEGAE